MEEAKKRKKNAEKEKKRKQEELQKKKEEKMISIVDINSRHMDTVVREVEDKEVEEQNDKMEVVCDSEEDQDLYASDQFDFFK